MTARDLRLLPLAGAVWAAALLCVFLPGAAWYVAGGGVLLTIALLMIALLAIGRTPASSAGAATGPVGLAILMLSCTAAVAVTAGLAQPARAQLVAHDGRIIEVTAQITSSSSLGRDGRLWFDAQSMRAGPASSTTEVSAPLRIGVEPGDGLDLGAEIVVSGQARMTDAGERAAIVLFATEAEILRPAAGVFAVAAAVRRDFVERAMRLPEPGAGLLPGLAVGDTRAVTPALNEAMRTSGLSHLTAVSGANCAIVVGAVFWAVALCRGGRGLRVVLSMLALAGFVVLVTPEPSVIRAGVMAGFAMLTVLLGRPRAGIGVLAACVTGIVLADPWLAATPGFALSAAASAALILLARPLGAGLARWMPHPLALAIAVPLAAQLVCGPIIALFAEQQSLIGIAANLLAAPAAPVATVIGLLACLAAPVPPLADVLAASAWLPAAWIETTATVTAALPAAEILIVPGLGSALLVGVLSAAGAVVVIRPAGLPAVRYAAATITVVALALGGAHALLRGPLATAATPDGWAIAACDVGQGDAVVIRSEGRIALIDTGPDPAPLEECLRSLGISRIDVLVLTHFDLDHVGGVVAVRGRVNQVLHGPTGEQADERMLQALAGAGARLTPAFAGMSGELGGASWRVLWPQKDSAAFPAGNDASIVLEIGGGGVPRGIYLGDLSASPQRLLLGSGRLRGAYPVVKVAHHGSADQDAGLYAALRPSVAVFSAGSDNDYGHPREDILDVVGAVGAEVLRTDLQGRVLLGLREDEIVVWTERAATVDELLVGADVGDPG